MKTFFTLALGIALGAVVVGLWSSQQVDTSAANAEKQPLYWVAPMDANYRRDGPGKSPMGMDLIPVYDEAATEDAPGTVRISPEVENNLGVRTATAEARVLSARITTVGYVGYDEDKLVHMHPRVEGWIEKLYVKAEGDPVQKGQPLYDLYSPELVNAQEDLLLALQRGEERLITGAKNRLRALKVAETHIEDLVARRKVTHTITYFAPQSGVVEALSIREGFFVQPGSTLFSIGAVDTVWIAADVFARQVNFLRAGQKVHITVPHLPGKQFSGELAYIYPTLNADTRTLPVRIRFNNKAGLLKPNMFAELVIEGDAGKAALTVPREAVIRTGDQNRVVLDLGEGRFKSIAVQLGRVDTQFIEIKDGLAAGDRVVTSAQFLLDSESSKSSDFLRMSPVAGVASVWVGGEIVAVDSQSRTVTASHDPVKEWDWPAMTMDFSVADSVDIKPLQAGTRLHMEISKSGDGFEITGTHIMGGANAMMKENTAHRSADQHIAEVDGVINQLDRKNRTANISRGPVAKWNRPAATLDFLLAQEVDLSVLKVGQKIRFRFRVVEGEFTLVEILSTTRQDAAPMDHSQHGGSL
ncbi:efflux RND transporter periplasmic adaptor subunit [Simiduia aestuariiviva]|uniref:Cu(I)/Ag(I) efflux system membrane fusion protein n=1 Tax=Simiduia aestuariiviva TaxID=1510459 RepID=A0A839UKX8_9GAMM|nr:efflux RND transporter periplasmic adaptor subunit [Simiduia aestuariiviva]MBB3167421.1 Cu(I)/Ag(I) efflux system membrane fusion protein [Simiduia aestuariiviva]